MKCGWWNREERVGCGVWHLWWGLEVHTGFWLGQLRDRDHWEDLVVHGRIIL